MTLYWYLGNSHVSLASQVENLDIETPAGCSLQAEEQVSHVSLEALEAALGIVELSHDEHANQPVEEPAEEVAKW